MVSRLPIEADRLSRICQRHGIRRLALFGSTSRGEDRPDSDIDLLVEFEPGRTPGLIALSGIAEEFSALLDGRRVDLRTPEDLSRAFRADVVRNAKEQYAA
ncbi:MAG: nucleotidyltransferase [Alphaproteobacteria bacterium]|nr:nucleotidyltransferase [Alphaproteobacteria bacterium]